MYLPEPKPGFSRFQALIHVEKNLVLWHTLSAIDIQMFHRAIFASAILFTSQCWPRDLVYGIQRALKLGVTSYHSEIWVQNKA